ncbi:MAG: acetoacetate decarboxylase [Deltaproteobacteria bacterium]|nr:acetoacetate decarboxylase [Deltaproteobacteria bacterium]
MFTFEDGKCYRMPAHFGGSFFDPDAKAVYNDVLTLIFRYTTNTDRLSEFLPEPFELLKPELVVQYQQCREVEWMAGSSYNLATIAVNVRFNGRRDRLEGLFPLVIWENNTIPILTGNMMGMPKIYADIEDAHIVADTYRTRLSFEGNKFLEIEMSDPRPMDEEWTKALPRDIQSFGWRYIPKVGAPGADLSQPIFFPMYQEPTAAWVGRGTLTWTELTWDQNPMQWHIIKALAALPMIEMAPVTMTKGRLVLMEYRGKVLE